MSKQQFKDRLRGLGRKLIQNPGLKIVSLVIATVFWFVVVNITDPIGTHTYRNVPVKILNAEVITAQGKTLEVLNDTDVLSSVTIKASRKIIQELEDSADNLLVTADMKKLTEDETAVPIDVTTIKYSDKLENIRCSSSVLQVNIENRKNAQFPIIVSTSGEIENGYILGNITTGSNLVHISGPESVVSRIKKASVDVQITGFTESISTQADIILYDEDGNVVTDEKLTKNMDNVRVGVEILATKKVPVKFGYSGTPAEGYEATGEIECDTTNVVIAGSSSVIDFVDEIDVPTGALNITGQSSNLNALINLSDYLPEGTKLGDTSFNGRVTVTVYIEPLKEETYSVALRNISIENAPDGFEEPEWAEDEEFVEFTLVGLAQNLEKIQLSQLGYMVDFSDYALANEVTEFEEGTYDLLLSLLLPEGVELKEPVTVAVEIEK